MKVKSYNVYVTAKGHPKPMLVQVVAFSESQAVKNAVSDAHTLGWRGVKVDSVCARFGGEG